jgi:hypothetical protein
MEKLTRLLLSVVSVGVSPKQNGWARPTMHNSVAAIFLNETAECGLIAQQANSKIRKCAVEYKQKEPPHRAAVCRCILLNLFAFPLPALVFLGIALYRFFYTRKQNCSIKLCIGKMYK